MLSTALFLKPQCLLSSLHQPFPRNQWLQVLRKTIRTTTPIFSMATTASLRSINIENVNPNVRHAEYAVRGELAVRAESYRRTLSNSGSSTSSTGGKSELPFQSVISANIGNPQQLDQKPLTFFRQVASLCENPELLEREQVLLNQLDYKRDAVDRARWLLQDVHSVGAYSQSQGAQGIREHVAKFITERDGHPSKAEDIYLSNGASGAVSTILNVIAHSPSTGILVPIPQYPLYTATLALVNARPVPYYLDETTNWSTNVQKIEDALASARKEGTDVRAIVIINPGNPTGGVLEQSQIKQIIQLAAKEHLLVIADEVYQQNIFEGSFCSFKRTLRELQLGQSGSEYDNVELVSLHSISKGMTGECGHRGGYMELVGLDPEVIGQIYKLVSISLCSPVIGQCLVECMVNPPKPGDDSYELYKTEYDGIFNGLRQRASALYDAFQAMEGVECQKPQGSMYLFPTIKLPQKAEDAARKVGKEVDAFYVSEMLDATGVCMVPGNGFGQAEGTQHFRTTFLPPGTEWVNRLKDFHENFMEKYR